jgi:hypothetical protein
MSDVIVAVFDFIIRIYKISNSKKYKINWNEKVDIYYRPWAI